MLTCQDELDECNSVSDRYFDLYYMELDRTIELESLLENHTSLCIKEVFEPICTDAGFYKEE
jgi:hypothetical protein